MNDGSTPTSGLPANLTGKELAEWLRIPHDEWHLQHFRWREGMSSCSRHA